MFEYHCYVLVLLVLSVSGLNVDAKNEGRTLPLSLECEENVDRTALSRLSLNVVKEGRLLRRVDEFVQLPPNGGIFAGKIVCIEVADLSINERGGYVERINGGVGENYAWLHFKSQVGRGLKFRITAYYQSGKKG